MKRLITPLFTLLLASIVSAQEVRIPSRGSEDTDNVMSPEYWSIWSDEEQARIDKDIDQYRKADAVLKIGKVKKGTKVKVEQVQSEFVFGASAFNWNQLGTDEANARYRELFGGLFNRATVPFYWKDFEPKIKKKHPQELYPKGVFKSGSWGIRTPGTVARTSV